MDGQGFIPVYLPDRTVVGTALIDPDGQTVTMRITSGPVIELINDDLIGLSIVYKSNEARDRVAEGDKSDG